LARRGADDLATSSFQDAIALNPDCLPARIGLGTCLFFRGELAEAETHFLHALSTAPDSVEASLGLISIQTVRGGEELKAAQERVNDLLRKLPNDARVLYYAAVVAEKSGDANTALGQYKRAAEVLLYGPQRKREP
jgi:tetratricopeptide (TPR) repeat protein